MAVDVAAHLEIEVDEASIQRAVIVALQIALAEKKLPTHPLISASVRVTDDREIHSLNQQYRGVDSPTDVLSFSFIDEAVGPAMQVPQDCPLELGEIVLSQPYAARQATQLGHALDMELAWLSIHGALQLVGYHHAHEQEAQHMEDLEHQALTRLGFNPD